MQVNAHRPVIVQHPDEIARRIGATPGLPVFGLHHHPAPRGNDRRAFRHGDVDGVAIPRAEVAILAFGALAHAKRPATPGVWVSVGHGSACGVAQGIFELGKIRERLSGPDRRELRQANAAA
ncbi:hypothetical protein D3C80_1519410 [compost metagenome]